MKVLWSQWISKLSERVPEQKILLVPGHFFYGHRFTAPDGMTDADLSAFLELALEGVSPFPLDQLAWGFLHEKGKPAYTFATSSGRLRQHLGDLDLASFSYALPGFITQFGITFEHSTVRFLAENGAVSALFYAPRERIPVRILSREVKGDILTDAGILAARDQLANSIAAEAKDAKIEEGVWIGDGYSLDANDRPGFHHRWVAANGSAKRTSHLLALQDEKLWRADLRDAAYQSRQQRERQVSKRLWQVAQGLAAVILLLCVLQFTHWGLSGWIALREAKIAERAPAVARIEQSEFLVSRLAESAERGLRPIRMLEIVNEPRPDPIFFTRTIATSYNQLRIEGESRQGIPTVNSYQGALAALPSVRNVEQAAETRGGTTTFDMTVTFTDQALSQPTELSMEPTETSDPVETAENP